MIKNKKDFEDQEIQAKIKHLNDQIHKIQAKRKQLSPIGEKATHKPNHHQPEQKAKEHRKIKKQFHHPNLDFVIANVANSPYLTSPEVAYSTITIQSANKIRYLKNLGKNIRDATPEETGGIDYDESKKVFMNDVVNFRPRFEVMPLIY